MAKKKTKEKVLTRTFDLDDEEKILAIKVRGKIIIEDSVCTLHRLACTSQFDATIDNPKADYIPHFANVLTAKYEFKINEILAYKIAALVFEEFGELKKNTDG